MKNKIRYFITVTSLLLVGCNGNNQEAPKQYKEADVIIMCGQSNMEGFTTTTRLEQYCLDNDKNVDDYLLGFRKCQISYFNVSRGNSSSGINNEEPQFVETKVGQGLEAGYFGPELGFAEEVSSRCSKKVYVIKYAKGGSALDAAKGWLPLSKGGSDNLFTSMVDYVNNCINYLKILKVKPVIKGICWMQGENDASGSASANAYKSNLKAFISDTRETFKNYAANEDINNIAFVDATISAEGFWEFSQIVNNSKVEVSNESNSNFCIDTNDGPNGLNLSKGDALHGGGDTAHYNIDSMLKLGKAFADVLITNNFIVS